MRAYLHDDLTDAVVSRGLDTAASRQWSSTAELLAYLASFDARELYLPAGYPSMYAYCVEKLHFPEDTAVRRIQAARVARKFPILFSALAEGRLHLTAVLMLAPHLTSKNAGELVEASTHKGKAAIQELLAERFPQPEMLVDSVISPVCASPPAPARVMALREGACEPTAIVPRAQAIPVAPDRFDLHLRVNRSTHDKLRRAQELLSHALPSGDIVQVFDRALDALIAQLEKRKYAATDKPRRARRSTKARHIPPEVRRSVQKRDQGQCTFVAADGHRCKARRFLEYDHVDPVARGGEATVEGMRLRCRGHNQYEAERAFGAEFMRKKREQARSARDAAKHKFRDDVIAGLRGLGISVAEAKRAVERSGAHATLEESMRAALTLLCPRGARMALGS